MIMIVNKLEMVCHQTNIDRQDNVNELSFSFF